MKYLIIVQGRQKGEIEGCDYTLGCNTRLVEVEAENLEDAYKKWWDDNFEEGNPYYYCEEYGVKEVVVIERQKVKVFDFEEQAKDTQEALEKKKKTEQEDLILKQAEEIKQVRETNT